MRSSLGVEKIAPFGVHVMREKPFAASLADADRMVEAMRKSGKLLAKEGMTVNENGEFVIRDLPPGAYRVRAFGPEHRPEQVEKIVLERGAERART